MVFYYGLRSSKATRLTLDNWANCDCAQHSLSLSVRAMQIMKLAFLHLGGSFDDIYPPIAPL